MITAKSFVVPDAVDAVVEWSTEWEDSVTIVRAACISSKES